MSATGVDSAFSGVCAVKKIRTAYFLEVVDAKFKKAKVEGNIVDLS